MNTYREIRILRERNKKLSDELEYVKASYDELKKRDSDIDRMYTEFSNCIKELKIQRRKYNLLNQELYILKDALIKNGFSEHGFKVPIYKIVHLRFKRKCNKILAKIKLLFYRKPVRE